MRPHAVGFSCGDPDATVMNGDWVRWIFIFCLGFTILDSILRPGFTLREFVLVDG